jgi:hypothetical protein
VLLTAGCGARRVLRGVRWGRVGWVGLRAPPGRRAGKVHARAPGCACARHQPAWSMPAAARAARRPRRAMGAPGGGKGCPGAGAAGGGGTLKWAVPAANGTQGCAGDVGATRLSSREAVGGARWPLCPRPRSRARAGEGGCVARGPRPLRRAARGRAVPGCAAGGRPDVGRPLSPAAGARGRGLFGARAATAARGRRGAAGGRQATRRASRRPVRGAWVQGPSLVGTDSSRPRRAPKAREARRRGRGECLGSLALAVRNTRKRRPHALGGPGRAATRQRARGRVSNRGWKGGTKTTTHTPTGPA